MKNIITLSLFAFLLLAFLSSCNKDENPIAPDSIKSLTMSHWGVDWSKGLVGSEGNDVNDADGETIGWCPNGSGTGSGIWYRSRIDKIYRISAGELSGVTSIDTTKWDNDVCDTPLANGDLWAAQANDGFVVFKVVELPTDPNDHQWKVKVQYKFSASTTF